MNKELEALKRIQKQCLERNICTNGDLTIIEKALKEHQKCEQFDDELYNLFEKFGIKHRKDLLKQLKALEILKRMFDWRVMLPSYKYLIEMKTITKEEYDLLKEVLL